MRPKYEERYKKGLFVKKEKLPKAKHLPAGCKLVGMEIRAAGIIESKEFGEVEYQDVRLYIATGGS